jgi:hypothetical protein
MRRLASMPIGQGAPAQQTPQPLQGWPGAGLSGVAACSQTIVAGVTPALCLSRALRPADNNRAKGHQFLSVRVQVAVLQ